MIASPLSNGRVTVVLPTYNRAERLPAALETILGQTAIERCDIVVVDDGSSDETPAVAARYADRIHYVRQTNGGLAVARNTGIRACHNEFVALLDDDDAWEPDKIARQLAAFACWPQAVLVAGRVRDQFADGRTRLHPLPDVALDRPVDLAALLFQRNFLPPSSVMIRTRALYDVGLFHPAMRRSQDSYLWVKLACRGPFVIPDAVVTRYRVDVPGALSNNTFSQLSYKLRGRYLLRRALRRRPDCVVHWRRGIQIALTNLRDVAYRQGNHGQAARFAARVLLREPMGRGRWEWGRLVTSLCQAALGGTGLRGTTRGPAASRRPASIR